MGEMVPLVTKSVRTNYNRNVIRPIKTEKNKVVTKKRYCRNIKNCKTLNALGPFIMYHSERTKLVITMVL